MKIKQKSPHPITNAHNSRPHNQNYQSSLPQGQPILTSPQAYLPSESVLYRELVSELGLMSKEEQYNFRRKLKEKYDSHLRLLQGHQLSQEKFRISSQHTEHERENKIKYFRDLINSKQNQAQCRKNRLHELHRQKSSQNSQNWKEIVQKNKHEYLRNIKNSMKLIKRWQNKLSTSAQKKMEMLSKVASKMQEHNEYVSAVHDRSRVKEDMESEYRIMRLEESLGRARTGKKCDDDCNNGSILNPESIRFKASSKTGKRQIKTMGSEEATTRPHNLQHNHNSSMISNSRISLSKSGSTSQLALKQALDQELVEQSLCKNIEKQKRIADARYVKSYLHQQRNKQSRLKQSEVKEKIMENLLKIQQEQKLRNQKLDAKFHESRKFRKYIFPQDSPSRISSKLAAKPSTNVSLPIIAYKHKMPAGPQQSPQQYSSMPLKIRINKKKIKTKFNKVQLQAVTDNYGGSYIYLTENRDQFNTERSGTRGSEGGKYDRKIMDKLRSISLVANMKYKRTLEEQRKINQMRSLAYLEKSRASSKKYGF